MYYNTDIKLCNYNIYIANVSLLHSDDWLLNLTLYKFRYEINQRDRYCFMEERKSVVDSLWIVRLTSLEYFNTSAVIMNRRKVLVYLYTSSYHCCLKLSSCCYVT
jgi:hypothetical protein